jgi:hypothetical protein
MNREYFMTNTLALPEQKMFPDGRKRHEKRLTIHLDHCSIQTSRATEVYLMEHNMIRLKQPLYSPDLTLSNFYLFPTIKEKLKNIRMVDEKDLFDRLNELLKVISRKELRKIFGA